MGMRIPSVRGAVQPSNGSDGETLPPPPPLSFRLLRTHFPYSLYIEQLPKALRGPSAPLAEPLPPSPWTKGVDLREGGGSTFAKMGGRHPWTSGVALRGRRGGRSPRAGNGARQPHSFRTRGGSGETGWPFRRNGITVPAQRHRGSGATASPFRRNGATPPRGVTGLPGKAFALTAWETVLCRPRGNGPWRSSIRYLLVLCLFSTEMSVLHNAHAKNAARSAGTARYDANSPLKGQ